MARSPLPLPTRMPRTKGQWAMAALAVLVALVVLWWQNRAPEHAAPPANQPSAASTHSGPAPSASGTDPASGLRWVHLDELPPEAEDTLALIDDGGPYPYDRDGVVFGNFEGILPEHQRGYYHEYTVPTPGEDDRGARRIVTGDEDEFFYTGDHYDSFERIAR